MPEQTSTTDQPVYDGYAVQVLTNAGRPSAHWAFEHDDAGPYEDLDAAMETATELVEGCGFDADHIRIVGLVPITAPTDPTLSEEIR